jgi:hypothetical protein
MLVAPPAVYTPAPSRLPALGGRGDRHDLAGPAVAMTGTPNPTRIVSATPPRSGQHTRTPAAALTTVDVDSPHRPIFAPPTDGSSRIGTYPPNSSPARGSGPMLGLPTYRPIGGTPAPVPGRRQPGLQALPVVGEQPLSKRYITDTLATLEAAVEGLKLSSKTSAERDTSVNERVGQLEAKVGTVEGRLTAVETELSAAKETIEELQAAGESAAGGETETWDSVAGVREQVRVSWL